MHVLPVWIFNTSIFGDVFSIVKKRPLFVNFHILIVGKKNPQCSTPLVGMRFCRHVLNSPRDKNKMLHNSRLLK
jgi:hypothetical protein